MNLKKGDWFTILRWTTHRDYSWCGDVFEVLTVNEPYLVAKRYSRYGENNTYNINLDLRKIEVKPVSEEYAVLNGVPASYFVESIDAVPTV